VDPREIKTVVAPLVRALRRLESGQGRIARRNARGVVAAAVRGIQGSVDRAFPSIRLPSKPGRRRASLETRRRRFASSGFVRVLRQDLLTKLVKARVRLHGFPEWGDGVFAPSWAVIIAERYPHKLAAAARDQMVRRAVLNDAALATQTLTP